MASPAIVIRAVYNPGNGIMLHPLSMHTSFSIRCVILGIALAGADAADAQSPSDELRVVSYNLYNYFAMAKRPQVKSLESRRMTEAILADLNPDVALVVETGGTVAAEELRAALKARGRNYPFVSVVEGEDPERRLAVLAKWRPEMVAHDTATTYNLGLSVVRIQRGFAHVVFRWDNGYRLHLIGAHLKSKLFDPRGQTDMRRYEARLLRALITAILEADATANVLVLGDFNDTPDSSPLNTVINRRTTPDKQLYDLRPVDLQGNCWTHLQDGEDTYSRIDYAIASRSLLPEVQLAKTVIPAYADWYIASDHRPLLVVLKPQDRPPTPADLKPFARNIRVQDPPVSFFSEGRVIGSRKARKPAP